MEYLGQSGDKALVNDRGRILRLPFAGYGKPPEPGTRINPNRDGCCCPSSIQRETGDREVLDYPLPRRTSSNTQRKDTIHHVLGFTDIKEGLLNNVHSPSIRNLVGKPLNFLLFLEDYPLIPTPKFWLKWDCLKNEVSLISLPLSAKYTFLFWVTGTYNYRDWYKTDSTKKRWGDDYSQIYSSPLNKSLTMDLQTLLKKLKQPLYNYETVSINYYVTDVSSHQGVRTLNEYKERAKDIFKQPPLLEDFYKNHKKGNFYGIVNHSPYLEGLLSWRSEKIKKENYVFFDRPTLN